ncbi:MAG: hypothetical protein ABIJ91_05090 [Candidatus Kuenenbacteria bacterium]
MEEKDINKEHSAESVQSQLDRVLDKLDDVNKEDTAEKKVFMQKDELSKKKIKKPKFKDIGWYINAVKKWVIFLAGLEILVYILSLINSLNSLMMDIIDPLLLLFDFVIFGIITWRVKRKAKETLWQGIVTCFFAGFGIGLIMSIFKIFWIREFWAIFYIITEPVFMGLVAGAVGLIAGVFIKRKRI